MFLVFIGSFTANNDITDVMFTLTFGLIGYFMVKYNWPRPPLILGLTLGKIAENYLWISTAAYGARWLLFPTVMGLIALTVFTVAYPTIKERMGKAKYERPEDAV
jgi:TctA family transporter